MVTGALLPQGRDSVLADVSGEDATTRHHSAPDSKTLPFASPASPRLNPTGPQDSPDGIFSPDFSPDRPSGMKKATRRWPMLLFYLVGASGFEPPTPTMSRWCSNQLSYAPAKEANNTRYQAVLASKRGELAGANMHGLQLSAPASTPSHLQEPPEIEYLSAPSQARSSVG